MKILRSRAPDGADTYYDADKLRKIDQEQGRRQLNSAEVEAMVAISVARQLAEDAYTVLRNHAKLAGATRRLNMAIPMLRNANKLMSGMVAGKQLLTISNNANDVEVILSAQPMPGKINVDRNTMMHICNRAMEYCDLMCSCTREESKKCRLRAALSNVPGVKAAARANSSDPERCPYADLVMEVEEDDGRLS